MGILYNNSVYCEFENLVTLMTSLRAPVTSLASTMNAIKPKVPTECAQHRENNEGRN